MRVLECACGERLKAADDVKLYEAARDHMDREHPEKGVSDEQVLNLIEANAYEATDDDEEKKGLIDVTKDKLTDH